jgi:hypothetical protein
MIFEIAFLHNLRNLKPGHELGWLNFKQQTVKVNTEIQRWHIKKKKKRAVWDKFPFDSEMSQKYKVLAI